MQKYAKKQMIIGRVLLIAAIISLFCFFASFFLFSRLPRIVTGSMLSGIVISFGCFLTYFTKFFWFGHTFRLLKKSGLAHYLDDIDPTKPTLTSSGICCGKNAFFCKRTGTVAAYDHIAWIYSIGGNLNEYTICFKNGKKGYIRINGPELRILLNNYISPVNNKIIEGNTVQAKREFFMLYPEAASTFNKGKLIGGSVLSAFALFCLISGIINNSIKTPGIIIIGIFGALGIRLLIYGLYGFSLISFAAGLQERLSHSSFFNKLCKAGTALTCTCTILLFIAGIFRLEPLFVPILIGYGGSMPFLFGSIFLRTGFFSKPLPTYNIELPEEMLDDTSYICDVKYVRKGNTCIYTFYLTSKYGWDYIRSSVDYLFATDIEREGFHLSAGNFFDSMTDITKAYLKGIKNQTPAPEWTREGGCAKVFGKSRALKSFVSLVYSNQTRVLNLHFQLESPKIATAYIETLVRRSFGTPDAMKLARPNITNDAVSK